MSEHDNIIITYVEKSTGPLEILYLTSKTTSRTIARETTDTNNPFCQLNTLYIVRQQNLKLQRDTHHMFFEQP